MSNVRVVNISVDDQVRSYDTYFDDTAPQKICIRTSGSQFFDEQHCFLMLIRIEERDGLKYRMKGRIHEANLMYLDQKKKNGWPRHLD
jgi:hypothetical protein